MSKNDLPGDWRDEINWGYVRWLVRGHAVMWGYGLSMFALSQTGLLAGPSRRVLGILALSFFAASLVSAFPIFGKANQEDSEGPVYSFQVFLILMGFLLSSGGYMWLLTAIGLDSIELW